MDLKTITFNEAMSEGTGGESHRQKPCTSPLCPSNEMILCTGVYGEPPFRVPVSPLRPSLTPSHFESLAIIRPCSVTISLIDVPGSGKPTLLQCHGIGVPCLRGKHLIFQLMCTCGVEVMGWGDVGVLGVGGCGLMMNNKMQCVKKCHKSACAKGI